MVLLYFWLILHGKSWHTIKFSLMSHNMTLISWKCRLKCFFPSAPSYVLYSNNLFSGPVFKYFYLFFQTVPPTLDPKRCESCYGAEIPPKKYIFFLAFCLFFKKKKKLSCWIAHWIMKKIYVVLEVFRYYYHVFPLSVTLNMYFSWFQIK